MDHLDYQTNYHTSEMTAVAAQFAGQMALRLTHDHLLRLDVSRYGDILARAVRRVYIRIRQLTQVSHRPLCALVWSCFGFLTSSYKEQNILVLRSLC